MLILLTAIYPETAASYNVSGVVDFSYRGYETKNNGNQVVSNNYFTQHYELRFASPIWDRRFLRINTGVGYSIINSKNSEDTELLSYDLSASFFPGRSVSADLYGRRSVTSVESSSTIAGYDVETTTYGASLYLTRGGSGSNNNNNNNNNNNRSSSPVFRYMPSVVLSHYHTESESLDLINAFQQERDDTRADLSYRYNSVLDITLSGNLEKFVDSTNKSSYENKSSTFTTHVAVMQNADLQIYGRLMDRTTENIAGFLGDSTESNYGTVLTIGGGAITQSYMYDYTRQKYYPGIFEMERAEAMLYYDISKELMVRAGLNYTSGRQKHYATSTSLPWKSSIDNGSLLTGIVYNKQYKPDFMGPFAFNTGYDFSTGYSDYSSDTGSQNGKGWYYENWLRLGVASVAWIKDSVSLDYALRSRRDDSPIGYDLRTEDWKLNLFSQRIPKTRVTGNAGYSVADNSTASLGTEFLPQTNSNQENRTLTYSAQIDYSALANWLLTLGGSRGQSSTNFYTLSTLTPPSQSYLDDKVVFAESDFNYNFTRNLFFRLKLRDEYREASGDKTQSYQLSTSLDYRFRQVFLQTEYGWREDNPDIGMSIEQQFIYAKLSRPF